MKIQSKLFLILFAFSLLLVTSLVLIIQWSIGRGMIDYVNSKEMAALTPVVAELAEEYKKDNSWSALQGNNKKFADLIFTKLEGSEFMQRPAPPPLQSLPVHHQQGLPTEHRRPEPELLPLPPGQKIDYALLNKQKNLIAGAFPEDLEYSLSAIIVDKVKVGFLAVSKRNALTQGYELDFIEQQRSYLWLIALAAMSLVTLVTLPLARHLVEPLKLLAQGMHKLTQGHYRQRIQLQRQDEYGELSRDFNELALTLDKNENARKRWLANISHELRTPMAILRGELEAMLDDVRPLSKASIGSAHDEVKHLQRLIDDLHQLTSADIGGLHYRKKNLDLRLLLQAEVDKYRSYLAQAGIQLEVQIENGPLNIFADRTRLCQLFENIIHNTVQYAQASLLKITLASDKSSLTSLLVVTFADNGLGVDKQHLPHLFEHLYRVEDSRNRKTGGTGLGLSISAHIVAAHQGKISAKQSELGGLAIVVKLPLIKK